MSKISEQKIEILRSSCYRKISQNPDSPFETDELISESFITLAEAAERKGTDEYLRVDRIVDWTYQDMLIQHRKQGFSASARTYREVPTISNYSDLLDMIGREDDLVGFEIEYKLYALALDWVEGKQPKDVLLETARDELSYNVDAMPFHEWLARRLCAVVENNDMDVGRSVLGRKARMDLIKRLNRMRPQYA